MEDATRLSGGEVAEEWRPVVGWESSYEISSLGRVRSLSRMTASRPVNGRILKPQKNPRRNNYLHVRLSQGERGRTAKIHVMVAEAFLGERPDGCDIRHLDGDPTNNAVANLRYGTKSENMQDAIRHGTQHNASKTSCPRQHPYDEANTWVDQHGHRFCRECARESGRQSYVRNREAIATRRKAKRALAAAA